MSVLFWACAKATLPIASAALPTNRETRMSLSFLVRGSGFYTRVYKPTKVARGSLATASGYSQGCDWAQDGTADGTYVGNSPRVVGWGATNLANQTDAMMNGSVEANVIRTPYR
jgi:hypothetical protein